MDMILDKLFKSRDKQEQERLEAFIDALPLEYCGWNKAGVAHWSRGFPELFGLKSIQTIRDIQNAIPPSDAAALEGMIWRLQKEGEAFALSVRTNEEERILLLRGEKGMDLNGFENFEVIWAEDTTEVHNKSEDINDMLIKYRNDVEQHRALLNALSQPLWVTDHDEQTINWCNKAFAKLFDQSSEDIEQQNVGMLSSLLDKSKVSLPDLLTQVEKSNTPETVRSRMIIGGQRRVAAIELIPQKSEHFTVGMIHDVTECEDLRAELDRYVSSNAKLLEQLSTAIAIYNANQKLEFYNQAYASLWGLEEQWLNTQPAMGDVLEKLREHRKLPEQADFKSYKKSWLDLFTTLLKTDEGMLYLPDGNAIRYMVTPHPMGGLMMTFEDVTSRLELESSYNTLIAVQRETLDNLSQGVVVYGSDARVRLYNPTYCKLWNLNPEDLEGHPHISQIIEKKKTFFKGKHYNWDEIKQRLASPALQRTDTRETLERSDGKIIERLSAPLPDGGVIVTYRDTTDSVRVQQILEEKNKALEEAEKLKTDFLAKVSYQLRTPLNAISGFSEILDKEYFGAINDKQREYTQGIMDATERLSNLINDILDLSSIEAGYLRLEKDPVDIMDMMDNIYELSRDWAGMEKLQIYLEKPQTNPGHIVVDERRLKQALLNIIRNAISYTPEGGKITLNVSHDDKNVAIKVTDTGVGIAAVDQDTLFEPFKTVNTTDVQNPQQTNSGLGLSLAQNIIALHKGTIDVSSKKGKGTIVTVTLPKK